MALGGIVVGSAALATLVVVTFVQAGREETTKVGCAPSLGGFGCGVSGTF
jgi:hypothetical protein